MGKLIKWLFGVLAVLAILLILAVVLLPVLIDPNDHKDRIVAAVEERTGRDLQIHDTLSLSVFPWLGIQTGGVTLGNAPGFDEDPFAQVQELELRVKLLPLLSRRIEVDTLVLNGLRLNLQRDAEGRGNWEGMQTAEEAPPAQAQQPTEAEGEQMPVALRIQGIEIEDAQIDWYDAQTGERYRLHQLSLHTGSLEPGVAVPVEAGFQLIGEQPPRQVTLSLQAQVTADAAFSAFQVEDLETRVQLAGEGLPEDGVTLDLQAAIQADLAQGTLSVPSLQLSGAGVSLKSQLQLSGLNDELQTQGSLQLQSTDLKALAEAWGSPILTADPEVLKRVSADLKLAGKGKTLRLDPIAIVLDDSRIDGHVHLLDTAGPVVRARLNVDAIDLDRYLPPQQEGAEAETAGKEAKAADGDAFAALRPLDLQAELHIGQLVVSKAKMKDLVLKAVSKGGVLKLDPMSASLYEGTFNGSLTLDARKSTPKVHLVERLEGIQVGSLLTDVAGQDRLLGKGGVQMDLSMVGLSEPEIRRSLNGSASFRFVDGAVRGVNIAQLIRTAGSALGLAEAAPADSVNQTDFSEMGGSVTIKDGVVSNQDLQAKSPLLRVEGQGTVNLPADTIDYRLAVVLVKTLEGQGGQATDQLTGVPIPVKIQGPLTSPDYKPDLEGLVRNKAKQRIEQEATKALENKLRGLFGR